MQHIFHFEIILRIPEERFETRDGGKEKEQCDVHRRRDHSFVVPSVERVELPEHEQFITRRRPATGHWLGLEHPQFEAYRQNGRTLELTKDKASPEEQTPFGIADLPKSSHVLESQKGELELRVRPHEGRYLRFRTYPT